MWAATLIPGKGLRLEERAVPEPGRGEVLIRVRYVGLCGSDQARFWERRKSTTQPSVIGHEFSGEVAGLGAEVIHLPLGQPVTVAPLLNCGECHLCRAGRENLCAERQLFGQCVDGALQEYVAVRADRVFPLPSTLPLPEGALVEPLAVACHAVARVSRPRPGRGLVLGTGAIGLLIAQSWQAMSGGPIVVADIDERRLAIASSLGFAVWEEGPGEEGVDTLIEASGSPEALADWLPALAPGGQAIVVGKLARSVSIDWIGLMRKEAEILTSRYFTLADFRQALMLLDSHQVRLAPLIGGIVPWQRLAEQSGRVVMTEAREVVRLLISAGDAG